MENFRYTSCHAILLAYGSINVYLREQLEHARAALDLFRSSEQIWENIIASGSWPCALPPAAYSNCFT